MKNIVKTLLDSNGNIIAYHPDLARVGGGITSGVFLSQLLYWTGKGADADGWIFKKQTDWTKETALSRAEQETARRRLRERGLLEEKLAGIPSVVHYRIDLDKLAELLAEQHSDNDSVTETDIKDSDIQAEREGESTACIPKTTIENDSQFLFERLFGPRKTPIPDPPGSEEELKERLLETEQRMFARLAKKPWLEWSDGQFKPWQGVAVEIQERVAWLAEKHTGLVPVHGDWRFWGECCGQVYLAGGGDWDVIEQGIRTVWQRELQYRPGHVKGFVDEVRKAKAIGLQEDILEVPSW